MTRSGRLALVVGDMNAAAQDLRNELRCLAEILDDDEEEEAASSEAEQHEHNTAPPPPPPLIEALPLFTAASLLLEISTRAEGVVAAVDALGTTAKFKKADHAEPPATTTLDAEAAMPVPNSNAIAADEAHGNATAGEHDKKETAEQTTTTSASTVGQQQEARDQVGQLVKLLMRRRSTKKWARGEPKVGPCPRPPLDFPPVHAPSPRSRSTELAGHPPVVPSRGTGPWTWRATGSRCRARDTGPWTSQAMGPCCRAQGTGPWTSRPTRRARETDPFLGWLDASNGRIALKVWQRAKDSTSVCFFLCLTRLTELKQ